jgi:hypothetical protein
VMVIGTAAGLRMQDTDIVTLKVPKWLGDLLITTLRHIFHHAYKHVKGRTFHQKCTISLLVFSERGKSVCMNTHILLHTIQKYLY